MSQSKKGSKARKIILFPLLAILILAAAGAGYLYWTQKAQTVSAASKTQGYQTANVKQGSLVISATGTGTLVSGKETKLSFSTSGEVAVLNVKVGDQVKEGQVLAQLGNLDTLQANVTSAKVTLNSAAKAVQDLKDNAATAIANAQLSLAEAKKTLTDAKSALVEPGVARCDQTTIDSYYQKYLMAVAYLDSLHADDTDKTFYMTYIAPAKDKVTQAYSTYMYCAGYTQYEIDSSHADLALAEQSVIKAQKALDVLNANNGVDPTELATAENTLANAQLSYDKAVKTLDGATLKAPYDGSILSVAGEQGDTVDTTTFITIADLYHPKVEFAVDETDMDKVTVGETATVVFDALPANTYTGKVTLVDASLTTVSNYQAVSGVITLDLTSEQSATPFLAGLTGSVEIINGKADNALLVPLEALRDLGDGQYGVMVVQSDGALKLQVVEVGLKSETYAEIKSGLALGDKVSTGLAETK